MIVIPSIDLHDGQAVKLTGGKLATRRVVADDPVALARSWIAKGARWLHIVDLNAAFGDGSNTRLVRRLAAFRAKCQVSGGLRDRRRLRAALDAGADRAIVGTRAILDPDWLQACAKEFRGRLWVAVDARGDEVVVRGWTQSAQRLADYIGQVDRWPFGGYLYTNVSVEGRRKGIDPTAIRRLVSITRKPICYSGGITRASDVKLCREAGVSAIIVGAAFYFGGLTFAEAARIAR